MLRELSEAESGRELTRRLQGYVNVKVLVIDEVGYLSYGTRYADLMFEVVTRRYTGERSVVVTTNKAFGEWDQIFGNAASVVTLVDRLVHRSEVVVIEGESWRLKEAKESGEKRKKRAKKPGR
jgi:DNA replication protein DnaC